MLKAVNKDDHKEVKVTLDVDGELTEEELAELADATITLTDADGKAITATFKEMDKDGKAIFEAAEDLEDAKVYTVTSEDLSVPANKTVTAEVAEKRIVSIDKETTGISANSKTIHLTAENQYREDATDLLPKAKKADSAGNEEQKETVKITGELIPANNKDTKIPLTDKDFVYKNGVITVDNDTILKEDNKVFVTVQITKPSEEEGQEPILLAENTFEFTVGKADEVATFKEIKAINAKYFDDSAQGENSKGEESDVLKPNYTVELTADLRDQFGNPFPTQDEEEDIRWVVTEGAEFLKDAAPQDKKATKDSPATVEYEAKSVGKVQVTAYHLATGISKEHNFEIVKTEISELNWKDSSNQEPIEATNKEEKEIGTLTVNEGADFSAEQVEFKVEALDENGEALKDEDGNPVVVSEDDVKVVAVDEKVQGADGEVAEDAETKVVVKVTTNKPGNYKITPIVKGTEVEAGFKIVTSKVDSEITRFEVDLEGMKEAYKFDTGFSAPITFFNKNNEVVKGEKANEVKLTSTNNKFDVKVEAITDEEGNATEKEQLVVSLNETANPEATETTTIVVEVPGSPSKSFQVKFVEAQIKEIKVEGEPITVQGGKETVELRPLTILDQHGDAMKSVEAEKLEAVLAEGTELKDLTTTVVRYIEDEETGELSIAEEGQEATGLALQVDASNVEIDKKTTVDVIVQAKAEDGSKEKPAKTSVQVTVNENSVLKDFTIEAATTATTQGGNIEVFVKPVDQYGEVYEIKPKDIKVTAGEDEKSIFEPIEKVEKNDDEGKLLGYTVTLTGATVGTQELTFTIGEGEDAQSKSETFTVGNAGQLVDKVAIEVEEEEYITADKEQAVALKAKVTNKEGKEVSVNAKELTWTIKSVKDAEGNVLELDEDGNVLDAEGETTDKSVTINDKGELVVSQGLTVDVEVQVESSNLKKATATYTFKGDKRAYKEGFSIFGSNLGTVALAPEEEGYSNVYDITFDGEEGVATAITLTFGGIDQYGDTFILEEGLSVTVPGTKGIVKGEEFAIGTVNIAEEGQEEEEVSASQLTLTVEKAGTTEYLVKYGEEVIKLNITVSEEAEAAKVAEDQAKADRADVETAKDQVKESYTVPFEAENRLEALTDLVKADVDVKVEGVEVKVAPKTTKEATEATHTVTLTKGDAKATKDITMTVADKLPTGVSASGQLTNSGKNPVEEEAGTEATYTYTVKGTDLKAGTLNVKVGDSSGAKAVEIEADESGQVTAEKVAQKIAEAINPVGDNANYTVKAEGANIVFEANEVGVNADFLVKLEVAEDGVEENPKVGATLSEGVLVKGTAKVAEAEGEAAVYELTVTAGATNDGTLEIKAGDDVLGEVAVKADQDATAVAQAIATALSGNEQFEVKAEDAKVTFTAKVAKEQSGLEITVADKKEETPAGE